MGNIVIRNILFLLAITFSQLLFAQADEFILISEDVIEFEQVSDSVFTSACSNCSDCGTATTILSLPLKEFPFILITAVLFILLVVKSNRKKILFWTIGILLFSGVIYKVALKSQYANKAAESNKHIAKTELTDTLFQASSHIEVDEFSDDEFEEISDSDEFSSFEEFSETEEFQRFDDTIQDSTSGLTKGDKKNLLRTCIALLATLIAGLVFRYSQYKGLRYILLLGSLVYLGFISGGCPCMISSFQNLVLFLLGESANWINMIWIVGLLVLTFFFGKIWCGWICHLGALQEFLFAYKKNGVIQNASIQKTLRITRLVAFVSLLIQLIVTRTNLFIKIDPFKVAFNLFSSNITGYILLAILLISSLFIYRPFCKSICPIGLILGWVSRIPGAYKLCINNDCKSCNRCKKTCHQEAIDKYDKSFVINEDCIQCGDCLNICSFKAISK